MQLTERILAFTLLGSAWVLWLLVFLSVISVAVMIERALAMSGRFDGLNAVSDRLRKSLTDGDIAGARELLGEPKSPEVRVALIGIEALTHGKNATVEAMAAARSQERLRLETRLGILGTLGNNAPFVGLFGTVLGIIKAFSDLAKNQSAGASAVMMGISEALLATAVGLMVAIPAVIAFNIFQGRVRRTMGRVDALAHLVLSGVKEDTPSKGD
jgi:biopolymer transport protein ExbB